MQYFGDIFQNKEGTVYESCIFLSHCNVSQKKSRTQAYYDITQKLLWQIYHDSFDMFAEKALHIIQFVISFQ